MMLDAPKQTPTADPTPLGHTVAALNDTFRHHSATDVMKHALTQLGDTTLVSSFGAESVVLLHMLAVTRPDAPVLFIDTEMLFAETLVYQLELSERLGLHNVRTIRAPAQALAAKDPDGALHHRDTDACCALRKVEPLQNALAGFDSWITGRKRFQGGTRQALQFFEEEAETGRIKVNPLAHWDQDDVRTYMIENRLPRHPLVARGYPSIGCAPCTSTVDDGEDQRAGRWRGETKEECGIHFVNGRMVSEKETV